MRCRVIVDGEAALEHLELVLFGRCARGGGVGRGGELVARLLLRLGRVLARVALDRVGEVLEEALLDQVEVVLVAIVSMVVVVPVPVTVVVVVIIVVGVVVEQTSMQDVGEVVRVVDVEQLLSTFGPFRQPERMIFATAVSVVFVDNCVGLSCRVR